MIKPSQVKYTPQEDDYWSEHIQLFTTQFPTYYTKPQTVWGRFHISEEKFSASKHEIIPITEQAGKRTYVMMQPYVLEPILTITVGLFDKPKRYADQDSPVGRTIGQPRQEGFREAQAGNAQAWFTTVIKRLFCGSVFLTGDSANTHLTRM